jgi:vancomycin resistance protein YoaR
LNNAKVLQGEVFSFNDYLGKRTKEKGYEKAPIIVKTETGAKKADGVGGGICQLSSTLYKAAKEAGLEIIERHSHSKKVGYLPLGEDASVSFGYFDLKFKNNKNIPIMIKVAIDNDKLTVRILGNYNKI